MNQQPQHPFVQRILKHKRVTMSVGVLSFFESTILFVPLEAILIPIMQLNRHKLWKLACAALIGCVLGAVFGYGIGSALINEYATELANFFGSEAEMQAAKQQVSAQGFTYIFLAGVTPIPFQFAMLMAGAIQYSLLLFVLATLLARSIRYFGLAIAVKYLGNQTEAFINKHKKAAVISVSVMAALFITLKLFVIA